MSRALSNIVITSQTESGNLIDSENCHVQGLLTSVILAQKLSPFGIDVHHICNGTDITSNAMIMLNDKVIEQLTELDIPLAKLVEPEQGIMTHAMKFSHWDPSTEDFWFSSGTYGVPLDGIDFHHYLVKSRNDKPSLSAKHLKIDRYSISCVAASLGRTCLPSSNEDSILSTLDLTVYCKAHKLFELLIDKAKQLGVTHHESAIDKVITQKASPSVVISIKLANGTSLKTDCVLNCSEYCLLETNNTSQASPFPMQQWYTAFGYFQHEQKQFETTVKANENGWLSLTTMGNNAYFHLLSTSQLDTNLVHASLAEITNSPVTVESIESQSIATTQTPWLGNVVTIGSGALRLPSPLYSALMQVTIDCHRFLDYLPALDNMDLLSPMYNNKFKHSADNLSLYYCLPLHCQSRFNSDFWQQFQMLPEDIRYPIDLFKQTGIFPVLEEQHINGHILSGLLISMGTVPSGFDVLLNRQSNSEIGPRLEKLASFIYKSALAMPTYDDFIQRFSRPTQKQHVGVKHE